MIDNPLNRLQVKRGSDLPQAELTEDDVRSIRVSVALREQYRAQARVLSNAHLAHRYGVHPRTIEKVIAGESWGHVE